MCLGMFRHSIFRSKLLFFWFSGTIWFKSDLVTMRLANMLHVNIPMSWNVDTYFWLWQVLDTHWKNWIFVYWLLLFQTTYIYVQQSNATMFWFRRNLSICCIALWASLASIWIFINKCVSVMKGAQRISSIFNETNFWKYCVFRSPNNAWK